MQWIRQGFRYYRDPSRGRRVTADRDHPVITPTPASNNTPAAGYRIRRNGPAVRVLADGAVTVPPALAAAVREAVLTLYDRQLRQGATLTPDARDLLRALRQSATRSAPGTPTHRPDTMEEIRAVVRDRVSVAEAAARLSCSESYVRRLCRTGRLPARRIGNTWAVDSEALT